MPGRVLHVRAGVIVCPHENRGRLPFWLRRMRDGGDVEVPGPPSAPVQLIDARDIARWALAMAARRGAGVFNVVAPPGAGTAGLYAVDSSRAAAAGLAIRPLDETVRDTAAWLRG
jgi:2'-hydroxyisoflavone reductase